MTTTTPRVTVTSDEPFDLRATFPPPSYEQWRSLAEAELKGAPFEKKLIQTVLEGIAIPALSTAQDWDGSGDPRGFPGSAPFLRGSDPLGSVINGWDIRADCQAPQVNEANRIILDELMNGATSIHLRFDAASASGLDPDDPRSSGLVGHDGVMIAHLGDLETVLATVRLDIAPIALDAGAGGFAASALFLALADRRGVDRAVLKGELGLDPLGSWARDGMLAGSLSQELDRLADLCAWTIRRTPHLRSIEVCSSPYHHAGADTAQDLAFTMATAVEMLRGLIDRGLDPTAAARQFVFSESLGCRFFKAIAKLRALRGLWAVLSEYHGVRAEGRAARIHVRTSRRVLTTRDPWINMLRDVAACFAGAVAGVEAITTAPYDSAIGPPDDHARRIARNTQIILREESHLGRTLDPAGGSWSLEHLTDTLAQRAWEILQEIERRGGMAACLQKGYVAELIDQAYTKRSRDIATRKEVITGVSDHPDFRELRLERPAPDQKALAREAVERLQAWRRALGTHDSQALTQALDHLARVARTPLKERRLGELTTAAIAAAQAGATLGQIHTHSLADPTPLTITPLAIHPAAEAFEELRDAADALTAARGGQRPRVFLATLGNTAQSLPRATYARNFFEAGGFETIEGPGGEDPETIAQAFRDSQAKIAVLCSSDPLYETLVERIAPVLKQNGARTLILAGAPGAREAKDRAAGVDRYIFIKCDVPRILRDLLIEEGAKL